LEKPYLLHSGTLKVMCSLTSWEKVLQWTLYWNLYIYIYIYIKHHKEGGRNNDILLQQENAKPHISTAITNAIAHLGFTVLPHAAYSPDLTPSHFHLLP
jgi:hypothetical protein